MWIGYLSGSRYKKMSSRNAPWSTSRNAADTVYQWKKTVKREMIRAIQKVPQCKEVFKKLGYPAEI